MQLYVDSSTAGDTWALEGDLTIQVDTADTLESRAGPGVVQVRDSHNSGQHHAAGGLRGRVLYCTVQYCSYCTVLYCTVSTVL